MALVTIRRSSSLQAAKKNKDQEKSVDLEDIEDVGNRVSKSLNECYFANKGAALVLGNAGCTRRSPARALPQSDIQHHLQAMFDLLTPEDTLKMAVKLESVHAGRTRYLVVVCRSEEAALLGIDCNHHTTVGLVLRVLADTSIKLDGDGGFSVCVCNQQHIFKPVSVQAMWSALQTLHRRSGRARELNHFAGGGSHAWVAHYEARITSDRSCLNEWHAMDCIESRRPPSPDSLRLKPCERDETEKIIRCTLKEIMMTVDLDEVTSKVIRGRLEEELDMDLAEFKSFIDQEMLTILGQMDAPTEVFEHVYLGSEWNASNLDELQRNGVRHILNVTREIDNFFPGMFDYLNIRVYDDDKTDLLKYWDNTFKYINKAKNEGSKVLVHCKMGISRSASVVIAYAMKAYNWNFDKAWKHVKSKRTCIKPNTNFINQLETYQGILDAMKNKEKLQRSKSETNLKSPKSNNKVESKTSEVAPLALTLTGPVCGRPRSWSPDARLAAALLPPCSISLESLAETRHMLMPCAGGSYSVSPNQIIRLNQDGAPCVKHIVHEIERSHDRRGTDRKHPRLHLLYPMDNVRLEAAPTQNTDAHKVSPSKNASHKSNTSSNCDVDTIHTWDPGEWDKSDSRHFDNDTLVKSDSGIMDAKNKNMDVTLNLDNHLGKNEDNIRIDDNLLPSRQSSWNEDKRHIDDNLPPSRQSSWSSFDSAVVPDLSRQSSWGSYDTRNIKHPMVAKDDCIPKYREKTEDKSVKVDERPLTDLSIISEQTEPIRSKSSLLKSSSNISDNERKFNETCAILKQLAEAQNRAGACSGSAQTWCGRLSASAPAGGEAWLRRRRRLHAASHGDLPRHAAGIVTSLKREFEALAGPPHRTTNSKSLSASAERTILGAPSAPLSEDLSVKVLVDRYDNNPSKVGKCDSSSENKTKADPELSGRGGKSRTPPFLRNSFCGVLRRGAGPSSDRPPIAPTVLSLAPINYPNVLVSTVMSKAQNKKQLQHGKTHPLTRLNMNRSNNNRCSNPVYNTM